jgi:hypothetical protein
MGERPSYLKRLRSRAFGALWSSQVVSVSGDAISVCIAAIFVGAGLAIIDVVLALCLPFREVRDTKY